jgi:hypothetical protein
MALAEHPVEARIVAIAGLAVARRLVVLDELRPRAGRRQRGCSNISRPRDGQRSRRASSCATSTAGSTPATGLRGPTDS